MSEKKEWKVGARVSWIIHSDGIISSTENIVKAFLDSNQATRRYTGTVRAIKNGLALCEKDGDRSYPQTVVMPIENIRRLVKKPRREYEISVNLFGHVIGARDKNGRDSQCGHWYKDNDVIRVREIRRK